MGQSRSITGVKIILLHLPLKTNGIKIWKGRYGVTDLYLISRSATKQNLNINQHLTQNHAKSGCSETPLVLGQPSHCHVWGLDTYPMGPPPSVTHLTGSLTGKVAPDRNAELQSSEWASSPTGAVLLKWLRTFIYSSKSLSLSYVSHNGMHCFLKPPRDLHVAVLINILPLIHYFCCYGDKSEQCGLQKESW